MRRVRSFTAIGIIAAAVAIVPAPHAAAHPLGNFSINRFSGLELYPDRVVLHHVVDMAEIPAFQEMGSIDEDGDGIASSEELQGYAESMSRSFAKKLSLEIDGSEADLVQTGSSATLSPGQGGLDVLRIDSVYTADLPTPDASIEFADDNFSGRPGWREVVASASGGQGIMASSVPSESVTNELRDYPREQLVSPPDVTGASVEVAPAGAARSPRAGRDPQAGPVAPFSSAFASLIEHDVSLPFLGFALLVAMGAGALHALGPGHGKSVMAAYLIGAHGRMRHAVVVGVAVSLMHTASVIGLGLVTLWASRAFPAERVYPYLSLVSGAAVLGLGAWLLRERLHRGNRLHHHHLEGHDHGHDHDHDHGPTPGSPLSWRGLAALALSGGLLPSPTALVVLLGAVALKRVAFGLTLVGAFSIGLAGALTLLGAVVLKSREFAAERLGRRSAALLPVLSAAAVCLLGMFLTTRAVIGL